MIYAIIIYLLYIWWSAKSNYRRIQKGIKAGKIRIKHYWEDAIQLVGTILLCYMTFGISWASLSLLVGLFAMYWLLFDLYLNKLRNKDWWYRSTEWYDKVLPANKYVAISIKIIIMLFGYFLFFII